MKDFQLDDLVMTWNHVLLLLDNDMVNEAYRVILSKDDDLYLIRLMSRTGVCYDRLEADVAKEVKRRAKQIGSADYIGKIVNQFSDEPSQDALDDTRNYMNVSMKSEENKYMRIEEYPNPFAQIAQAAAYRPEYQSFSRPMPPQSSSYWNNPQQPYLASPASTLQPQFNQGAADLQSINKNISQELVKGESQNRSHMEKLKKEAAEVYEMLRKKL